MSMEAFDLTAWDDEPDYTEDPPDLPPNELEALDRANWHLRSVARIRDQRAALVANFDAEIARLRMRLDARSGVLDREEAWHTRPLVNLHRAIREKDPTRTSITLACGTLKSKAQQPEWVYDKDAEGAEDFAPFLAWAREHHPELIAPRTVGVKIPDAMVDLALEALRAFGDDAAAMPAAPAKAAVKSTLVKKDEKGKKVLVWGIDPETGEHPPGLTVVPRDPEFSIDTSTDDAPPPEE